ncbi:MAG: type II toxin-antitoxin system Phd/YefM family antitoxin [Betaproteobacteria bacterium]
MKDVKVTELRQNLPAYLAKVRKGERVRVTSRGKVVAELVPPATTRSESEAAWARLRGSVLRFDRPTDPAFDPLEWDINK